MTATMTDAFFRAALEDDGCPVSAGWRDSHRRAEVLTYEVDLSRVPDDARAALIQTIDRLIHEAIGEPVPQTVN